MKSRLKFIKHFIEKDIWRTDFDRVSKLRAKYIRLAQVIVLGVKSFNEDKLNLRASALTYFTTLSIVPVLALGFGIAKGFGLEELLEKELSKSLSGQQQVLDYILTFTRSMLDNAKGGLIAGFGLALLLWSVIKLLNNIEDSFNMVWEVKKSRSFVRKFTDYMSMILIAPIFMALASSISIYISSTIGHLNDDTLFNFTSTVFLKFAKIIPYIIIWLLFTIIYIMMPNTKVKFRSALIAGIIAGTIFQVFQDAYVFFQSRATRLNTIYGSFAALPLFLIWLQSSWFVVLIGAEISYILQNAKLKGIEIIHNNLSFHFKKKIAVVLVKNIVDIFEKGKKAPTSSKLAIKLKLPISTIEFILGNLTHANIISKVIREKEFVYQPAKSTNIIKICDITDKYERFGTDNSKFITDNNFKAVESNLDELNETMKISEKNILLKDLKAEISEHAQ